MSGSDSRETLREAAQKAVTAHEQWVHTRANFPSEDWLNAMSELEAALDRTPTPICRVLPAQPRPDIAPELAAPTDTAGGAQDGEVWPGIQCLKFASAEDAKRAEKLFNDLTDEIQNLRAAAPQEQAGTKEE